MEVAEGEMVMLVLKSCFYVVAKFLETQAHWEEYSNYLSQSEKVICILTFLFFAC